MVAFMLAAGCMDAKPSVSLDSSATQLTTATQAPAPASTSRQPSPVSTLTFDTTQWTPDAEAQAIAASGGRVTRKRSLLEIRIGDRSVTLDDEQPDTVRSIDDVYAQQNRHVYLGELPTLGYDVIGIAPVQSYPISMLLLNQQTGDRTEISGVPVPSPNRKRFVVVPYDYGPEGGIEIWSIASGAPRYEWGVGDEETRPIDYKWADDSTVTYRAVPLRPGPKADTVRMQFAFRDGEWKTPTPVTP